MDVDHTLQQALQAGAFDRLRLPERPLTARQRAHLTTLQEVHDDRARWLGIRRIGPRSADAPHLIRRGEGVTHGDRRGLFVGIHPHTCRPFLAEDDAHFTGLCAYFDQQYASASAERISFRLGWLTRRLGAGALRKLPASLYLIGVVAYMWLAWPFTIFDVVGVLLGGLGAALLLSVVLFVLLPLVAIPVLIANIVYEMFALEIEERWLLRRTARASGG